MEAEDAVLREAVERIARAFAPRRIVLFGSRAWGHPRAESDYDLLVLVDESPDVRRLAGRIRGHLAGLPAAFDILVRRHDWWQAWCRTPLSIEARIERDGRELHVAP